MLSVQVWLETGRPTVVKGRQAWLIKLRGIETPEAAEQLRGLFLLGDAAARPPLEGEDEFYVQVSLLCSVPASSPKCCNLLKAKLCPGCVASGGGLLCRGALLCVHPKDGVHGCGARWVSAQELLGMTVALQASGEVIGTVVNLYDGTGAVPALTAGFC